MLLSVQIKWKLLSVELTSDSKDCSIFSIWGLFWTKPWYFELRRYWIAYINKLGNLLWLVKVGTLVPLPRIVRRWMKIWSQRVPVVHNVERQLGSIVRYCDLKPQRAQGSMSLGAYRHRWALQVSIGCHKHYIVELNFKNL